MIVNGIGRPEAIITIPVVNDSMYAMVSSGQLSGKNRVALPRRFQLIPRHTFRRFISTVRNAQYLMDVNPIYYAGLGADTYIGIHGNGKTNFNFIGQIDEVRVNNSSLTPDWVKLCFMNQKASGCFDTMVKVILADTRKCDCDRHKTLTQVEGI